MWGNLRASHSFRQPEEGRVSPDQTWMLPGSHRLPDLRAEVNCGWLFLRAGRNWEAPCGWRWGRRLGKGSNLGTVINEKFSPHDFLYLVPLASLRLPRGNQKFKLVLLATERGENKHAKNHENQEKRAAGRELIGQLPLSLTKSFLAEVSPSV